MKLPADYQKIALELYEEGATDAEVCKALLLNTAKFHRLYVDDGAFQEVVDYGRTLAKAWWDTTGRSNLKNKLFNTALYVAFRKNVHGWSEKNDSVGKINEMDMSQDELKTEFHRLVPQMLQHLKAENPDLREKDYLNDS